MSKVIFQSTGLTFNEYFLYDQDCNGSLAKVLSLDANAFTEVYNWFMFVFRFWLQFENTL